MRGRARRLHACKMIYDGAARLFSSWAGRRMRRRFMTRRRDARYFIGAYEPRRAEGAGARRHFRAAMAMIFLFSVTRYTASRRAFRS